MNLLPLEDFVIPMICFTSKDTAHTDIKMTLSIFLMCFILSEILQLFNLFVCHSAQYMCIREVSKILASQDVFLFMTYQNFKLKKLVTSVIWVPVLTKVSVEIRILTVNIFMPPLQSGTPKQELFKITVLYGTQRWKDSPCVLSPSSEIKAQRGNHCSPHSPSHFNIAVLSFPFFNLI